MGGAGGDLKRAGRNVQGRQERWIRKRFGRVSRWQKGGVGKIQWEGVRRNDHVEEEEKEQERTPCESIRSDYVTEKEQVSY